MERPVKCESVAIKVKHERTGDQCTFYEPTNELVSDSIQNTCPSEECRVAEDVVKMKYDEIEFKEEISSTYFNSEYKEYKTVTEPKTDTIQIGTQNTYPYEEHNIESSAVESLKTPVSCQGVSEAFTKSDGERARCHTQKKSDSSELCTKKDLKTHQTREKFSFPQNCPLELHMPTGTREKSSPDVSNKTFTQKCSVKRHNVARHREEKSASCDVCRKTFTRRHYMKIHMFSHTGQKPFSCDVCTKAFSQKGNLKTHMLIHTGEKPFSCDVCTKIFTRKNDLKIHMFIHTGEKSFWCDVCEKAFIRKSDLKIHMLIHTGEKYFSCDICAKAFNQRSNLKTHMLTHTEDNFFSCDICAKAFTQKGNLKMHMLIHTGENSFSCDVCDKAFNQKSNLKTHMTIHNSISYNVCINK